MPTRTSYTQGTPNWVDLQTTDQAAAKAFYAFYGDVLGQTTTTMDMDGEDYVMFEAGGKIVGGTTAPQMPSMPNHWKVYFEVADVDATVAKAAELGGAVVVQPFDLPVGRLAVISDPQGAVFSIMKSVPQPALPLVEWTVANADEILGS